VVKDTVSLNNLAEIKKENCFCGEKGEGIARTKTVCGKHFSILQRDNFYRFRKNIEIEADLLFYKRCLFARCANRFIRDLENSEVAESVEFCSRDCSELEEINRERYEKM